MRAIGICLGASTVSVVEISKIDDKIKIDRQVSVSHNGDPKKTFIDTLKSFNPIGAKIAVTGRKFRSMVSVANISEPQASEIAYEYISDKYRNIDAIASLGGETFLVYPLDSHGKIASVISKNQCASGTGEFFMQQIKRMDLSIDETMEIAQSAEPFKVSGRCSVFCKSDCTHALNKGIPKSEVSAGLCRMISDKISELLDKTAKDRFLLVGGITKNKVIMDFLAEKYPNADIPAEAAFFEAFGAAIYAQRNDFVLHNFDEILKENVGSFTFHPPLARYKDKVVFKNSKRRQAVESEKCILGLDVGSTTTKAVLIGVSDSLVLASEYIYTNGNPIKAARDCYKSLLNQIDKNIIIIGLGTTGSGRHIAGLHALTDSIFNEITAHASAAVHFDKQVDTIFEIGGQDAKYTYIVNKVPSDYAMNEACSAGTGSFIEEAAWESLAVKVKEIQDIALSADNPPNFSDQCAAFISSDIKTAQQENISKDNIIAGLVYSICLNYVNRVKGNRPVGNKIFMQGGVCYNQAVPIAMAALTGKEIIVPPDPGLMGAFGVALEVKEKIKLGIIEEKEFDLKELSEREVVYHKPFICAGGREKCDLKCSINMIEIMGKKYPFGGSCDKYYSMNSNDNKLHEKDLVKYRNYLIYDKYAPHYDLPSDAKTIGLNYSFHTHTLYPLFYNFFSGLGFNVIHSDKVTDEGLNREISSFCYPAQLSLGLFQDLLDKNPDYIFLPSILEMYTEEEGYQRLDFNCTCVFVSGETFYIKQAYKDKEILQKLITPNLNFGSGWASEEKTFIDIAKQLGINDSEKVISVYKNAVKAQYDFQTELFDLGRKFVEELEKDKKKFAMVIIGRPYNSFVDNANKGIPQKFASRNVAVIPYDMLDFSKEEIDDNMYWESGKKILRAAKVVKNHPQLFATYISNFSCAPDSMIMNSFRNLMGTKPALTLELDSHSADAGINTRIEAAIDIINNYRKIQNSVYDIDYSDFRAADIEFADPIANYICSNGEKIPLNSPDIDILIPSMGDLAAPMFAAALRSLGFNAKALAPSNPDILKYGRANSSGKECLPVLLMAGSLIDYIENEWNGTNKIALFTVQGAGNCRLGQYPVFIRDLIKRNRWQNVAQMVLMNEDGFAGLGSKFALRGIQAIIASDVLDDVRSAIMANAKDPENGLIIFNKEYEILCDAFANDADGIYKHLEQFAKSIKDNIIADRHISDSKYVALLGEIYVRRDGFSHKWLNKRFAEKGFVVKDAYISEWILYVDYLLQIDLLEPEKSIKKKFERYVRNFFMRDAEKKIKKILEKTNFYEYSRTEIEPILNHSKHILPLDFKGEPGLTLGVALHETLEKYCGVINLGPFGCMPTRFVESIAVPEMNIAGKAKAKKLANPKYKTPEIFNGSMNIPFLTIESDGNVFPQLIEARIETFMLQAERASHIVKLHKNTNKK